MVRETSAGEGEKEQEGEGKATATATAAKEPALVVPGAGVGRKVLYKTQTLEAPSPVPPRRRRKTHYPRRQTPDQVPRGGLLDGFALVGAAGAELPEEVEQAALPSCNLEDVETEDLYHFTELHTLDLGDNRIADPALLANLAALCDLRLPCNGLRTITVPAGVFAVLERLDLSYNALRADALHSLAQLPRLKMLDLTANCISLGQDPIASHGGFETLEELGLGSQTPPLNGDALHALAALPSLKRLAMSQNKVCTIKPMYQGALPALEALDLSSNGVEVIDDVLTLAEAPCLCELLLWDNPLATFARGLPPLESPVVMPGTEELLVHITAPPPLAKPTLRALYGQPLADAGDEMPNVDAIHVPVDKINGVFERLDAAIDSHTKGPLAALHEGEEAEKEERLTAAEVERQLMRAGTDFPEDDRQQQAYFASARPEELQELEGGEDDDDDFFVTGGGMAYDGAPTAAEIAALAPDPSAPRRRAGGIMGGGDSSASLQALKFALHHPLAEGRDEPTPHYRKTTKAMELRRVQLKPIEPVQQPQTAKQVEIESIESILSGMKSRLQQVESALLSATTAASALPEVDGAMSTALPEAA